MTEITTPMSAATTLPSSDLSHRALSAQASTPMLRMEGPAVPLEFRRPAPSNAQALATALARGRTTWGGMRPRGSFAPPVQGALRW